MKNTIVKQFLVTIILIFALQSVMLVFLFGSYYRNTAQDIKNLSVSNMKSQASMVESYLNKGGDVLWFAAETVDQMLAKGADSEELLQYLLKMTAKMQQQFDENFTGIYGYLNDDYVDGAGWDPPADYNPKERTWYQEGMEGKGDMVLSTPYVDAQTGKIIISFSQMLSDGESVLALDIILDEVQNIAEHMTMGDMGYGFITDGEGLVVAHTDPLEVGKDYSSYPEWADMRAKMESGSGNGFEIETENGLSTVFTDTIAGGWQVVIVALNERLYHDLRMQLLTGILLSLMVLAVIVVFCIFSARKIIRAEKNEQEILQRLERTNVNTMNSLASAIDAKDRYTSGHSRRVAEYALEIARRMGKSEEEQQLVYFAAILHDVGKIRVPNEVINKPGKLTEEEFDQIRVHPVSGYHILHGIHEDPGVGYAAKYHHERYDGKGYPSGLAGEDIPEIARIIAVADAYDAMASDRSYRKALPQKDVRDEIERCRGSQFDPEIADIMLEIIDEDTGYRLRQAESSVQNVLVVDDDRMAILTLEHVLADVEEVKVIGAASGQEALDILEHTEVSVVMLDLKMPDVDGFTLYQKIREKHDIPAILMTGDRSAETLRRIRELGINDYLTKPLRSIIIKETIHGVLHRYS